MKKVLITGGTGFVGRHLREELQRRRIGYVVFSKSECDLTQFDQTQDLFHRHSDADVIVHLACLQAAADYPAKHPAELLQVNSRIHLNVLACWHTILSGAKFIGVGSSCAYPAIEGGLKEDLAMTGEIHGSVYSYAFTKRLLLNGIRAYNDQYKLNGSCLIPATMFGEYDDFHIDTAHVTGALIGKFVRAMVEAAPAVEVWGDGTQVRDFLDVKDFVAALLYLVPRLDRDVVNIGPGKGIAIRDLAEIIRQASGFKGEIIYRPAAYVGVQNKYLDVTKLNTVYGYHVPTDHAPALARTVAWYRANYVQVRDKRKFAPAG